MKSILFIIPYFGRFNNYFEWWLKTCKFNPSIDWLIVTDCSEKYDYPPNVHVEYTSFEELKERAKKALEVDVNITKPYKLCDLRPAYGIIFADEIRGYDFWGHCDVDVLFGDIRRFLTEDVLEKYEKISRWGHMSLYKNNFAMNTLFRKKVCDVPDVSEIFSSDIAYCFDEVGMRQICKMNDIAICDTADMIFNIDWKKKAYEPLYWEKQKKDSYAFVWEKGHLYACICNDNNIRKREIMYAHFQKRSIANDACIDENKLFVYNDILSTKNIQLTVSNYRKYAKSVFFDFTMLRYFFDKILVKLRVKRGTTYYSYKFNK